jgi:regulator of replication initiation timing/uncharacterized C2H2 Zn-finger protein
VDSTTVVEGIVMSSEASTCPICLEALVSEKPIGVTAPCGHCLHTVCWDGWVASRLGRQDSKCPMCNKQADSFVRIFVDFGAVNEEDDDDDSLSSDEGSFDDDENLLEEPRGDGSAESPSSSSNRDEPMAGPVAFDNEERDDSDEEAGDFSVIAIDEPVPNHDVVFHQRKEKRRKSSEPSAIEGNKYKRIAKRLKNRVSVLESQRKQQGDDLRKFVSKLQKLGEELQRANKRLEANSKDRESYERTLEGLNLHIVELSRKLEETSRKLALAQQAASRAQHQLHEATEMYQRKLSRVSAESMNEVQQMKDERPKLINENRVLKEMNEKLRRRLGDGVGFGDTRHATEERKGDHAQKATKKILRAVSECHDEYEQQSIWEKKEEDENEGTKKISAHAARMRASVARPVSHIHKPSALAALNAVDNVKQLEPILPSFLVQRPNQKRRASASLSASSSSQRIRHTSALQQKSLGCRKMPSK